MNYLLSGLTTAFAHKKMICIFYLINLGFGLAVALPFRTMLDNFAGHSLMGKSLAEHFDLEFIFEFLAKNNGATSLLFTIMIVTGAMYWMSNLLLSGGAYGIFLSGESFSGSSFWKHAGKNIGRFCRLFLWSVPVFFIFYCVQFIEPGVVRVVYGKDPYQNILFWGSLAKTGLSYVGILLYYLVFDYARIYLIRADEKKSRKGIWHGIKFTFRHLFSTFSLSLIVFLFGIIALLIYNPVANALHAPSVIIVLALFIVQQLYIMVRMYLRLTLYAAQASLHTAVTPTVIQAPPEPIENAADPAPALNA